MGSKWIKGGKAAWSVLTGGSKVSPTIISVPISPNIATKRNIQDKVVKAVDEGTETGLAGAPHTQEIKQSASKWKRDKSKELKKFSYKWDKLVANKKKK